MAKVLKTCNNCKRDYSTDEDFLRFTTRWRQCAEGNLWVNCECGSTMLLPKGKYDWYAPEKQLSSEAQSIFNILADENNFPHLDTQVLRIQEILSREEFKLGELAEAIKHDPLIASNVLSVANNLKVEGVSQIDSIKHAIVYIGKETLREIVLIAGIRKLQIDTTTFVLEDFWDEAINAGMIAESLAAKFAPHLISDEVYIAACLANIGKLLMGMIYPETADRIIEAMYGEETPINWYSVEQKMKVPKHTILGEVAAVIWGLPTFVSDIASKHHSVDQLLKDESLKRLNKLDIVSVAVQIGHLLQVEPEVVQDDIIKKFCEHSGVSKGQLDSFIIKVKSKIKKKQLAS